MVFQQGLLISGIGMGLVFLMIIALWGIMAGMVALFKQKEKPEVEEDLPEMVTLTEEPKTQSNLQVELAAVTAVAYALAIQNETTEGGSGQVTMWNPATRAYQPFRQHKGW